MADVEILRVKEYVAHNPAFDQAQIDHALAMTNYQRDVTLAINDAEDGDPDFASIPLPEAPDVPESLPYLMVFFRTSENDRRGLYACVPVGASSTEIAEAIRATLKDAAPLKSVPSPGDVVTV